MRRLVILPDIHCPNHEMAAIRPILEFIKFYKPTHLVQLGDFCDWDSVSSYEVSRQDQIQTITKEIDSSNALLDKIDEASGFKCKKVMIGGNHEARYAKFIANNGYTLSVKRMKHFSTWQDEYNLKARGWKAIDYGGHYELGKLIMTHGFFTGPNAARRMSDCFPGRNLVFGHLHSHQTHGFIDEKYSPIESESIGTLSKFNLSYLHGKHPINWVHAFQYVDMDSRGYFSKHFVRVINGSFVEYGIKFV